MSGGVDVAAVEAFADEAIASGIVDEEDTETLNRASPANQYRGEVDLVLNETRFVLRPSHQAMVAVEEQTGKSCLALAVEAADCKMTLRDATIITTLCIQAWGASTDDEAGRVARAVDQERIGELIHEYGLMKVVLRLEIVLLNAVTGGCKKDGSPKEGEAPPTTGTDATPGVGKQGSRRSRSGGPQSSSGKPRRTSSGARSRSGKK